MTRIEYPNRAFQLWGRHAGIDRQTIMGIYSRVASGEPKIDDFISKLAEYCKNKIQYPGKESQSIDRLTSMSGQLTSLKTQLESDVRVKTESILKQIRLKML